MIQFQQQKKIIMSEEEGRWNNDENALNKLPEYVHMMEDRRLSLECWVKLEILSRDQAN